MQLLAELKLEGQVLEQITLLEQVLLEILLPHHHHKEIQVDQVRILQHHTVEPEVVVEQELQDLPAFIPEDLMEVVEMVELALKFLGGIYQHHTEPLDQHQEDFLLVVEEEEILILQDLQQGMVVLVAEDRDKEDHPHPHHAAQLLGQQIQGEVEEEHQIHRQQEMVDLVL